ncbi:MAG: T9SS type B sorting domain-containing protein [Flavobacterium sp.]|uniref:T9SS type B sorting domain-containing protein n=1 Tax=Flavobacterium sp. TaxID=239 RepID=UPI0011FF3FEF|nr:T9SS type B sorting domain-containing protein [Flavobacterium sp.]RZJ66623.1 MAG: T9SS type B sorting domain-containing protein [Flavobacterium sp.]
MEIILRPRISAIATISTKLAGSLLLFFLLFFSTGTSAQLVVSKTDETCDGNAKITCTITNPAPSATFEFRIFKLPDLVTPISILTSNGGELTGLDAGTYRVVATVTVSGVPTTFPSQDVTIVEMITPLQISATFTEEHCEDGTITAVVTAGFPLEYELFEGPETVSPQSSPLFTGLLPGLYTLRVTDICGAKQSISVTVPHNEVVFYVGGMGFLPELPDCNHITVTNPVYPADLDDDNLLYPLTMVYTVYSPNGTNNVVLSNIGTTGNPDSYTALQTIPFWYGQMYTYDLTVTDACGTTVSFPGNVVDLTLTASFVPQLGECSQYFFYIEPSVYVAPYNIVFTSFPAGFDPTTYNPNHPGPFSGSTTDYGDDTNTVPFGDYSFTLTDACGHTYSDTQTLEPPDYTIHAIPVPHPGCEAYLSDVQIQVIEFDIASIVITVAPPEFPYPLPFQVPAAWITEPQEAWLFDLWSGNYTIEITDTCGLVHPKDFTVDPFLANLPLNDSTRADCELGKGGIRVRGGNANLITSVIITAAPAGFPEPLPFDASLYIAGGTFTMGGLLPGDYTMVITDNCLVHPPEVFTVMQYLPPVSDIQLSKNCASFNLAIAHTSNATTQKFWLQKKNSSNQWTQPNTGTVYVDGIPFSAANALELQNNSPNLNLQYIGEFRLVTTFQAYENGNIAPTKECMETLLEFDNTGDVEIVDVIKLTCDGALISVKVIADGVPPFHYKIIEKNGNPFVIDNGNNDTFIDLEPAVYKFSVEHFCGQSVVKVVDIASLPSLINAIQPNFPLIACDDDDRDGTADFDLTQFNATIIGTQDPNDFALTYHSSLEDAEDGVDALAQPYNSATAQLFARLKFTNGDCYQVVSVEVIVNEYPKLDMELRYGLCPNASLNIVADSGMDSYLWSSGETTNQITVSTAGTYTLTVTQTNNGITCTGMYTIEVVPVVSPTIREVEVTDWTDSNNTIVVHTNETDTGDFLYSIDGTNYQQSNTFTNLMPGEYHVWIKDIGGCGDDDEIVHLLMYPRFFTPNADGYNDYWKVKYDQYEPALYTYIYDRYGKLITGFPVGSQGWDGTYNGKLLPSTDYWFLVIRENGKEKRGHFSMKR